MPLAPPPITARPRRRTRRAAVQRSDETPSARILSRPLTTTPDAKQVNRLNEWQGWARRYAETVGVVRFAAGITADTCARCTLLVEERNPEGDWQPTEDARFTSLFDAYCDDMMDASELIRSHAWHYQIVGECVQIVWDGKRGTNWSIFSTAAVEFRKNGTAIVKLAPDGRVSDGTAFEVDAKQATRMWIPHPEWRAYATSPMSASIDDLHRYETLARVIRRTGDSRLAMNGILWTPGEAHKQGAASQTDGAQAGAPASQLQKDYYELATRAFEDDDDVLAIAPPEMHWDKEFGAPQWIKVGEGLDPRLLAHLKDATEAFARGINLPAQLVAGGGPGDANHWTEWLVDAKFFASVIAPGMDRITHNDLTATFLAPVLRMFKLDPNRYRVGYDPTDVIVSADQSDLALQLHLAGLLAGDATLDAGGFDLDQRMLPDEIEQLLQILSKGAAGGGGGAPPPGTTPLPGPTDLPVTPGSTVQAPPEPPPGVPKAAATRAEIGARSKVRKLSTMRRDLGRALLASAEVAYTEALRRAGVKVAVRSRRKSAAVREAALAAVEHGAALRPHLAAIGLTESEMLDKAFASYGADAKRRIQAVLLAQAKLARDAGLVDEADALAASGPSRAEDAAAFLMQALNARARSELVDGGPTVPAPGESTGRVPAKAITDALKVAEGRAIARHGETLDDLPEAVPSGESTIEELIMGALGAEDVGPLEYVWVHGFYGDPVKPYEPHEDLGASGFTTTKPGGDYTDEADDDLANSDDFPDGDYYFPGDHDGCTCEWVPTGERARPTAETPERGDGMYIPGPGSEAQAIVEGKYRGDSPAAQKAPHGIPVGPDYQPWVDAQGRTHTSAAQGAPVRTVNQLPDVEVKLAYTDDQEREQGRFSGPGSGADTHAMVEATRTEGGLTIKPLTGETPTAGYCVALSGGATPSADVFLDETVDAEGMTPGDHIIDDFLAANADHFDGPDGWLGLWHDEAHNEVAVDRVRNVMDRDEALALGAQEDQQSIWDVVKGEEIPIGGTGGRNAGG